MSRSLRLAALVALAALAAGGAAVYFTRSRPPAPPDTAADDDPRLRYAGPYRNVRPDVKYVGDAACKQCHEAIAEQYARHPMGRSMAPASELATVEDYSAKVRNPFEMFGYTYRVERRGDRVVHREERHDERGQVVAATECEVKHVIGSGTRGRSYLVDRGGRLFQSPISWFSEKGAWDISPGYSAEIHFTRPIPPRCVFCHGNQAEPIPGTLCAYREPVMRGYPIGCERCHGPGELHVQRQTAGEQHPKPDDTIVNPRQLEPLLRDAVCEQCHLQGEERVLRRGRSQYDFRPGLPLHEFLAVFIRPPELDPGSRSVGQIEQMAESRCAQASGGKLGCISCHDPHRKPTAAERVPYYRDRCLACHQDRGCRLDVAARKAQQPDDSCIACHMSKAGSTNIPHTAVTDHRIPRRPAQRQEQAALKPGESPLRHYHAGRPGVDATESARDLAVALGVRSQGELSAGAAVGRFVIPPLEEATKARPDDFAAWEALGHAAHAAGKLQLAAAAYDRALTLRPDLERGRVGAAEVAEALGQTEAAIAHWEKAIELNPALAGYHVRLARLYADRHDWPRVRAASERARGLDGINVEARVLLVNSLLHTGAKEQAAAEFAAVERLRPANLDELRRWYAGQLNR